MTKQNAGYIALTMVKIAAACFLGAYAFYKLTLPVGLIPGGFSGIGAVVELVAKDTPFASFLTAGIISVVLNIPFYFIAYKGTSKRFFWFSVYGMVMWSVMLEVVRNAMPEGVADISFGSDEGLRIILYSVVSGVVGGIGSGYIVRLGYSTGGSELVATLVNKRLPFIKIGTVGNAIKLFVIVLYAVCLGTTPELVILTVVSGFIANYMVDVLVDGFKAAKAYYIISNKPGELSAAILHDLNRSSTLFSGEGQRQKKKKKMLMCIVYNHEVSRLRAIVHGIDKRAFLFSTMVKEAYGTGFAEQKAPLRLPAFRSRLAAAKETPSIKREVKVAPLKTETAAAPDLPAPESPAEVISQELVKSEK
jgi:uncharacterized membrane-anchored protein YitT (DUF2179 family)